MTLNGTNTVRSEKEKMLAGELYLSTDAQLVAERQACRHLVHTFNHIPPDGASGASHSILKQLLGSIGAETAVLSPFFCDYGSSIFIGSRSFINMNCTILDCARIEIGNDVLIGPGVHIYAATHPLDPSVRRGWGPEMAKEVVIGDDVWIGGAAVILPGVKIGNGAVVGAGSVVTRDVDAYTVVAGNPARAIRTLDAAANSVSI